jgi:hypothetical protein
MWRVCDRAFRLGGSEVNLAWIEREEGQCAFE